MVTIENIVSGVGKIGKTIGDFSRKYAAKALVTGTVLAGGIAYSNAVQAQTVEPTGPNEPTPNSIVYNPFARQNTHMNQGKAKYEYDCSGDFNLDGDRNTTDAQQVYMGGSNRFSDTNASGKTDATDGAEVENGNISSDWENLTKEEREDFALNYFNNVYMAKHNTKVNAYGRTIVKYDGWDCDGYALQANSDLRGVQNMAQYKTVVSSLFPQTEMSTDHTGEGNLPSYVVSMMSDNGIGHRAIAILTGEDGTEKSEWLFIDGQTGKRAGEDTPFMRAEKGDIVSLTFHGHYLNFRGEPTTGGHKLIDWESNGDGTSTTTYVHPNLITTRNQDTKNPTLSGQDNSQKEYQESYATTGGLENMVSTTIPTATDNMDPNPDVSYTFSTDRGEVGTAAHYNFNIDVNVKATDNSGNAGNMSYTIPVRDNTAPTGELNQPTETEVAHGTDLEEMAFGDVSNLHDASGTERVVLGDRFEREGSEANHSYWSYPVSFEDASGNFEDKGIWQAPGVRDFPVGVPNIEKSPEFVQTFTRGNEINIKYMPQHTGDITFSTFDTAGRIIDNRTVSGYTGGEGNFSIPTNSSGMFITKTVQNTGDKVIVDTDKSLITR